ncbi:MULTISPECIES: CaiB/BaiF CoA transferase family protein [Burkholderia]|uniref:CaiB/BaiF CoA transferase family protein n=1 Tax=Burkholderia TaxID=32008 RepID=UPI0008418A31|nr:MULTISPECIES: CaiB/BaiF CoA-transferase family protein [unclassified Burkholderia]AOK29727.1 hypothetical protein AQ611_10110 [Burkholderia sp. Bp7605]
MTHIAPALPLAGITVVSFEHAIAAPFATRQLADLGARVIKVERPGSGDFARGYDNRARGVASHFVWCNRSKESLTLDMKAPPAREILEQLLAHADVVVQNLAPGAASRLGIDEASLRPRYPKVIVCDISGYGDHGPYRDKKAYDLMIQSESGFVSITGSGDAPAKAGLSIADIASGMYAYSGILSALIARSHSGLGTRIEVSMLEALTEWMGYPLYYTLDGAPPPARTGAGHATIFPYGPFPAGDGRTVLLGLQNEREWQTFCSRVLGDEALATDPRFANNMLRSLHRDALTAIIIDAFAPLTTEDVLRRLDDAGIANARVREMDDVWAHPQLRSRGRWTTIDTPAGRLPALLPPVTIAGCYPVMNAVPALGEHTVPILRELGYSDELISRWREERVV